MQGVKSGARNVVLVVLRREAHGGGMEALLKPIASLVAPQVEIALTMPALRSSSSSTDAGPEEAEGRAFAATRRLPPASTNSPWSIDSGSIEFDPDLYRDALRVILAAHGNPDYARSALRASVESANVAGVRCVLHAGVDPNAPLVDGKKALHLVVPMSCLRSLFAKQDRYSRLLKILRMLLDAGADPSALVARMGTPLHKAARNGIQEAMELLLGANEAGTCVDVNVRDLHGRTPLHQAKDAETARLLISRGALVNTGDQESRSPLHVAVTKAQVDVAEVLLQAGAHVNAVDGEGKTVLHLAAMNWWSGDAMAQLLVARGAHVEARDHAGATPLHVAAGDNWCDVARFFLEHGADVTAADADGNTALHHAARRCRSTNFLRKDKQFWLQRPPEMATLLLLAGAQVNARNAKGQTPLHVAVASSPSEPLVRLLLDSGAEINARDHSGKTAYNLASQEKSLSKFCDILLLAGADTSRT